MNKTLLKTALLATALAAAPLVAAPLVANGAEVGAPEVAQQPHRALYAMGLAGTSGVGGPSQIRGVMSYEVTETCEAWKTDTKVLIRSVYGEDEVETVRKMSSWESKDGLGFRFRVDETQGGKPSEAIRGVAVLDGEGQAGIAEYTQPRTAKAPLPRGTVFPTAHMTQMIRRSIDASGHFGKVVFDGSSTDDPFVVSAIIGPASESKLPQEAQAVLGSRPRWEARLAYFPVAKKSETPEFELTVTYRNDGIVETIRQEYEDHAIESRLRQIELLARPTCFVPDAPLVPEGGDGNGAR